MLELDDNSLVLRIRPVGRPLAFLIVLLVVAALGFTDLLVGTELSFSIFYLIPVTLAVFLSGRALGLAFAFICSVVWVVADIGAGLEYDSIFVPIWNTLVRLGYFIFHAFLISKLLETIRLVRETSLHDPLTKAANWRYFEEYSNKLIKSAVREKKKIAIIYIDVDDFKTINDNLGHNIGDEVLIGIAGALRGELRPSDLVARLGGDEFAVILTDAESGSAGEIIARMRNKVDEEMTARGWKVTMSIGAMVFSVMQSTIGPMLKRVDDLMYEVKRSGKNNVKLLEM